MSDSCLLLPQDCYIHIYKSTPVKVKSTNMRQRTFLCSFISFLLSSCVYITMMWESLAVEETANDSPSTLETQQEWESKLYFWDFRNVSSSSLVSRVMFLQKEWKLMMMMVGSEEERKTTKHFQNPVGFTRSNTFQYIFNPHRTSNCFAIQKSSLVYVPLFISSKKRSFFSTESGFQWIPPSSWLPCNLSLEMSKINPDLCCHEKKRQACLRCIVSSVSSPEVTCFKLSWRQRVNHFSPRSQD